MAYFALFYEVVDDFVARRALYRDEHLRLAREAHAPHDRTVAESFAREDPYVVNGLVKHWEVRPWTIVVGSLGSQATASGAS